MSNAQIPGTTRPAVKYGLYMGLASVIFFLLLILTNQYRIFSPLSNIILMGGLYYGMKEYKELGGGLMTFGQGLSIGLLESMITGLMVGLFFMVYTSLDAEWLRGELAFQQQVLEKNAAFFNMDDEALEASQQQLEMMLRPSIFFLNYVFTYLLVGFLFSLVIAAIQRRSA